MRFLISDVNERIKLDPAEFIAGSDAAYFRKVATAADVIVRNMSVSPVVLLAGPSGSSKTTTAANIVKELNRRGVGAHKISLDDYFKTLDRRTAPRTAEGEIDFESPRLLDSKLLADHFDRLKRGGDILVPRFDFKTQSRIEGAGEPLSIKKDEVVIFEGIHALNDEISSHSPEALGLFVTVRSSYIDGEHVLLQNTAVRLMRRLVRDYNFRGTDVLDTLKTWANVCLGEAVNIDPYKDRADYVVDTGLPYEVSVLTPCTQQLLADLGGKASGYPETDSVLHAFSMFEHLPFSVVPDNSPLREFIGPSGFVNKL